MTGRRLLVISRDHEVVPPLDDADGVVFTAPHGALRDDALERIGRSVAADRLVLGYADESWKCPTGRVPVRSWKPAWSPERLRGQDYVGYPVFASAALVNHVGLPRRQLGDLAMYDFLLRASEAADRVDFIPEVLHHTDRIRSDDPETPEALAAREAVVGEHLARLGLAARATTLHPWQTRVERQVPEQPLVSIIIPTAGTRSRVWGRDVLLIEECVKSVIDRSTYRTFEVVVVTDVDTDPALIELLWGLGGDRLSVVPVPGPFNFSAKINRGVLKSSGDVLIFLNDDTLVETPGWIEELVSLVLDPGVGIAGPKLLLSDGRIQSAGHYYDRGAKHVAPGCSGSELGPDRELAVCAERSGITMACAAVRRSVFEAVGGLCLDFPRAYNDVDFCNKLALRGLRSLWTPWAVLRHFESLTRDPVVTADEVRLLADRWGTIVDAPDRYLPHHDARLAGVNYVRGEAPTFLTADDRASGALGGLAGGVA
jgi:O-antigen biosynthesis protein